MGQLLKNLCTTLWGLKTFLHLLTSFLFKNKLLESDEQSQDRVLSAFYLFLSINIITLAEYSKFILRGMQYFWFVSCYSGLAINWAGTAITQTEAQHQTLARTKQDLPADSFCWISPAVKKYWGVLKCATISKSSYSTLWSLTSFTCNDLTTAAKCTMLKQNKSLKNGDFSLLVWLFVRNPWGTLPLVSIL